jgi:hypothetical protein
VVGSAIFREEDYGQAITSLNQAMTGNGTEEAHRS